MSTPAAVVSPPLSAAKIETYAYRIAGILDEMKSEEIVVLDLHGVADFADYFIIATTRSRTQMRGAASKVVEKLKADGFRPVAPIEDESPRWTIIDYGHIVVHLFENEARALYQLEQVWGDAEEVNWRGAADRIPKAAS